MGAALGVENYRSDYFRAPFGIVTVAVRRAVRQLGLKHVLLSHYGWDTRVGPHNFAGVVDLLITNAKTLADVLVAGGLRLASGGTDNHLMLCDVTAIDLSGSIAEVALDKA
ncbi:MAG: hypothetical protein GY826_18390, partial [Fuerstiella sp.]|nr:hypothetical protein [Fuerstiella sp.]